MNNIQPDGSWRDPTAQMAMDIGLGKVNPNCAGFAAVEQAHRTYGSAHVNGLWGYHVNAPAFGGGAGSGAAFSFRSSPSPASGARCATGGYGSAAATWMDHSCVGEQGYKPYFESARPPMSRAEVRALLGLPPLSASEDAAWSARYLAAQDRRAAAVAESAGLRRWLSGMVAGIRDRFR